MSEIFNILTIALQGSFALALLAGVGWGLISILFSPCHLSSIPLIIGYISSQPSGKKESLHWSALLLSFVFAIGILISIAIIGFVTSASGRLMGDVGSWGNYMIAFIFLIVGLYLLNVIRINWNTPFFFKKGGLGGAFLLGLVFGIGLGPCTFAYMAPILGLVFTLAKTSLLKAMLLVAAFGIGQTAIIVIAGSSLQWVQYYLHWNEKSKASDYVRKVSGVLVLMGGFYFVYTTF